MFYMGADKISPAFFEKGESSGDVVEATNYAGSIQSGDKVYLSENYSNTTSIVRPNYTCYGGSPSIISRDGLRYYVSDRYDIYNIDSDTLSPCSQYQEWSRGWCPRYMDNNTIWFKLGWRFTPSQMKLDYQPLRQNWFYDYTNKFLYQINVDNGEILDTYSFNELEDEREFMIGNLIGKTNTGYYYTIDKINETFTQSGRISDYSNRNWFLGSTHDDKFLFICDTNNVDPTCCGITSTLLVYKYDINHETLTKITDGSVLGEDFTNIPNIGSKYRFSFNEYTGNLVTLDDDHKVVDVYHYNNEQFTKIMSVDISWVTQHVYYATISDDLSTIAIHIANAANSGSAPGIIRQSIEPGWKAVSFNSFLFSTSVLTGKALENADVGEKFDVSTVLI